MAAERPRQPQSWGTPPPAYDSGSSAPVEPEPLFRVDDITVGPYAHGYGATEDGKVFSFRVVGAVMTLRVYRTDLDPAAVPVRKDVDAVATARVSEVDLADERSIIAMVRDMTMNSVPVFAGGPLSLLGRMVRTVLGRRGNP